VVNLDSAVAETHAATLTHHTQRRPLLRRWLGRIAFFAGAMLLVTALLKLLFPGLLFWATDSNAVTIFLGDAPGLPTFLLLGSASQPLVQLLFPYSLPLTIGMGAVLADLAFDRSRRARLNLIALSVVFTLTACVSHAVVWREITPQLPGPMVLTGLLAAALLACAFLVWERDWLHSGIRAAASRRDLDTGVALADIQHRLSRVDQTTSLAQTQLRETAAQDERNRLARDLHDTIKQQLFSINMAAATAQTLAKNDPEAALQMVQEVRNLSQQAQVEMKALLTQLKPAPLATVGLVQAIGDQLEALHFRSEVEVELNGALPDDTSRLPLGAQEALFRITQEALSNIARHARATHASVTLLPSDTQLLVRITDNGKGFDAAAAGAGMGMGNMRARIADVGGTLAVQSAPGAGTTIEISLPLAATAPPLPEDSRHYLLDRFYGTVQANAVSFVLIIMVLAFGTLFGYGVTQGIQSDPQDAGIPAEFAANPALFFGLLGLLLTTIVAVPVLAIVLQVVVRTRRRRLKQLANSTPAWGDAFRALLHLDDKWYMASACITIAAAAVLSRGFVSANWATGLTAGAVLAVTGAFWLLIRLVQDLRELRDNTLLWSTRPWLRARMGEFLLSVSYLGVILFDLVRNTPVSNVAELLTPVSEDQLVNIVVAANSMVTLFTTLAGGYFLWRASRAGDAGSTLPDARPWSLTRADRISLVLQMVIYAGATSVHFAIPDLASIAPLLTMGVPIVFGLTRAATPLKDAAARYKGKL
jgi:signal transduction histidine kinase